MNELKKRVMDCIKRLNEDWVGAIKEGETSGEGIDLSAMFAKFSGIIADLDVAFTEAAYRTTKKKGGFLGGK